MGMVAYHFAFIIGLLAVTFQLTPFQYSDFMLMLAFLYPPLIGVLIVIFRVKEMSLSFSNRVFLFLLFHWIVMFGVWDYFLGEMRPVALITAFMGLLFVCLYASFKSALITIALVSLVHVTSGFLYTMTFPDSEFWVKETIYLVSFIGSAVLVAYNLDLVSYKIRQAATQDALTGLLNRRGFQKLLKEEFERCKRYHLPASLLMIDIDHFKKVNDQLGHDNGDTMLVALADILKSHSRDSDKVCRWGGEEFVLLLPQTGSEAALTFAERLLASANQCYPVADNAKLFISFSAGVVELCDYKNTEAALIAVDEKMYQAKENGRNQIKS